MLVTEDTIQLLENTAAMLPEGMRCEWSVVGLTYTGAQHRFILTTPRVAADRYTSMADDNTYLIVSLEAAVSIATTVKGVQDANA